MGLKSYFFSFQYSFFWLALWNLSKNDAIILLFFSYFTQDKTVQRSIVYHSALIYLRLSDGIVATCSLVLRERTSLVRFGSLPTVICFPGHRHASKFRPLLLSCLRIFHDFSVFFSVRYARRCVNLPLNHMPIFFKHGYFSEGQPILVYLHDIHRMLLSTALIKNQPTQSFIRDFHFLQILTYFYFINILPGQFLSWCWLIMSILTNEYNDITVMPSIGLL